MSTTTSDIPQKDLVFEISREFDTPRDLLWKAHTEPARLEKWFGPKGFTMRVHRLELRTGGIFHYGMRTPDGKEMWGRWIFQELAAPERMTVIVSFSDENGGIARHPFAAAWPLETISTMTLTERAGRTTLTIRWRPHNATAEESDAFAKGRDGMKQGWTGTLDQLADYIKTAKS
jgi:uncharacterized protein YndB with AHSA1/START domain